MRSCENISAAVALLPLRVIRRWRNPFVSTKTLAGLPGATPAIPPFVMFQLCPFQLLPSPAGELVAVGVRVEVAVGVRVAVAVTRVVAVAVVVDVLVAVAVAVGVLVAV